MAENLLYRADKDLALIIQPNEAAIIICSVGTGFGIDLEGYCLVEELS